MSSVPSVLAMLSRAFFEKEARVDGRIAVAGDTVPLTSYVSRNARLSHLATDGSLFVVTVRPPDHRLLLVAVLEKPTFSGDRWTAAVNAVPVTDITDIARALEFDTGSGLTAPAAKLAMALQTPRVLTDADVVLLRAAALAEAAPAPPAVPAPAVPARARAGRKPGADAVADAVTALGECAELIGDDPVAAFDAALVAWRATRWERLAGLVERIATVAETPAAADLRTRIRRGAVSQGDWLAGADGVAVVDRGALLTNLRNLGAKDAAARIERAIGWGPDPRSAAVIADVIRRRSWSYTESGLTWTKVLRLLKESGDRRVLAAAWCDRDAMRARLAQFPGDWLTERIVKALDRLAATAPPPACPAGAVDLLDAIERALPAGPALDVLTPVAAVPAPLPVTTTATAGPAFGSLDVREVRESGAGVVLGVAARPPKGESAASRIDAVVVTGDGGVVRWAGWCGAAAVAPDGTRIAVLTVTEVADREVSLTLDVRRIDDGGTIVRVPLGAPVRGWRNEYRTPSRVDWLDDDTVVAGDFMAKAPGRLFRYDLRTAELSTMDMSGPDGDPENDKYATFAVDRAAGLVATAWGARLVVHDTATGRLRQAFTLRRLYGPAVRVRMPGLHAVGGGRFAFLCANGTVWADPDPGHPSTVAVFDGATAYPVDERPAQADSRSVVSLPDGRLAEVIAAAPTGPVRIRTVDGGHDEVVPTGDIDRWTWTGRRLAAGRQDAPVRLHEVGSAAPPVEIPVRLPGVPRLAVSADGSVVAGSAGSVALIWGRKPKPVVVTASAQNDGVSAIAVTGGGHTAVAVRSRAEIRRPDGRKGGVLRAERTDLTHLAGCPAHDRFAALTEDGTLHLYDDEHAPADEVELPLTGPARLVSLRWSPSGRLLVAAAAHGAAYVVDAAGGTVVSTVDTGGPVLDVWFANDEVRLLGRAPGGVLSWHRVDGSGGAEPAWHRPDLTALAGHPGLGWWAFGHEDGRVTLHGAAGGAGGSADGGADADIGLDLGRHHGPVTALAFAADRLVVGAGRPGEPGSLTVHTWPEGTS